MAKRSPRCGTCSCAGRTPADQIIFAWAQTGSDAFAGDLDEPRLAASDPPSLTKQFTTSHEDYLGVIEFFAVLT